MESKSANNTPTAFSDGDIQKILKSVDTNYELPEWQKNIRGLVARLRAAERALDHADTLLYENYDPHKDDCTFCETFLTPCKDTCECPKLHEALEEWRKTAGKGI